MNRRSPFFVGLTGAAGVAVTYGLVELLIKARSTLILIGLGLFIAAGLDPVVAWLTRRGLPRWSAVLIALAGVFARDRDLRRYLHPAAGQPDHGPGPTRSPNTSTSLQNHNSELGKLNARYHIPAAHEPC